MKVIKISSQEELNDFCSNVTELFLFPLDYFDTYTRKTPFGSFSDPEEMRLFAEHISGECWENTPFVIRDEEGYETDQGWNFTNRLAALSYNILGAIIRCHKLEIRDSMHIKYSDNYTPTYDHLWIDGVIVSTYGDHYSFGAIPHEDETYELDLHDSLDITPLLDIRNSIGVASNWRYNKLDVDQAASIGTLWYKHYVVFNHSTKIVPIAEIEHKYCSFHDVVLESHFREPSAQLWAYSLIKDVK